MSKKRPSFSRLPYLLCSLGILLLTGLALGFPAFYFFFSDQRDFSQQTVEDTGLDGQVYVPANTSQTVEMLINGSYNPTYSAISSDKADDIQQQVRLCLEKFAQSDAKILGEWFSSLLLDNWDCYSLIAYQDMAGVGVFDNMVCTSQLRLVSLEGVGASDQPLIDSFTLIFDPDSLTIYAFSLSDLSTLEVAIDETTLDKALRSFILEYLQMDPANFQMSPAEAMDAYYSSFGPFLPQGGKYDYRFYLYPVSIYWDGHTLMVNQN